jgi:uncharacterized protein (TIGR02588 family)
MAAATKSRQKGATATTKPPSRAQPPANDIPALEWIAAGVGLALALTAVGFTAWDAAFGDDSPPSIEVRLKTVTPTAHGFVAQVEALNHGGSPAGQVEIEGVLDGAGETAHATFDYIPEQSSATGGLIFEHDPRQGRLTLRATGFVDPS